MTAITNRWRGILTSCHVEESQSTSRKDCTTSLSRLTLTSRWLQSRSHWVVLLSLSFLFTSQATTTLLPEICHIWAETSKDRYLSWVTSMDTTICGAVMMLTPGWSHWEIHRQTQSVCSQWRNPHLSETPSPACEQTNISDRPHHLHTRTCSEKCVGGAARHPWQWSLSHTNFDPTISSRDTTELWSFTLGVFQGRLGTVSRSMLGRHHWGHPRGSRPFTLLCWDHNQGCKWQHPKGNDDSQEIEPLVWWRIPGSPEG